MFTPKSNKIRKKIFELIESKNLEELKVFLLSSNKKDILAFLKNFIYTKDGTHLLNCTIKSLDVQEEDAINLKKEVYESVLKQIKNYEDTDEKQNGNLVASLVMHVDSFPTVNIIYLINIYVEHLEAGLPFYGRWTELLSKLLSACISRSDIVFEDKEMNGEDFQYYVVKKLCDFNWDSQTTTTILPIFKDINLPEDTLRDVICKIREVLKKIEFQSVPPIVYHLILLCQKTLPSAVLEEVTRFFNEQENNLLKEQERRESEGMSEIDCMETIEKNTMNDLIEAQSTTIHHITDMAKYGPTLVRDYLKVLKYSWIPSRIFTPFNLALALSLVHIGRYKNQIIDCIKSCVLKHYKFEEKCQNSLWMNEAFKKSFDLLKVFKTTVNNCKGGWDQVSEGMVLVCFSLLESGSSLTSEMYPFKKTASLAISILPSIFKKEPRLAADVLKTTSCFVLSSSSPQQYIDLLGRLVKNSPVILLDHINQIRELLEQIIYLPFNVGTQLLIVLLPLIKLNFTLKDSLILILRKMLFSREVENRKVAVQGFINILAQFRVMGALPSSQASFSFSSTLSQISVDVHSAVDSNTNEALCLELLGVLRRCFTQQCQIRCTLYEGLPDVAKSNSKLVPNIMELLYQHLSTFVDIREDILNPIKLQKTVASQGETLIIVEPLGVLLLSLSKCKSFYDNRRSSRGMDDDDEEDFVTTLNGICSTFDSLVEKLAYCDLDDLNIGNISCSSGGARGKTNTLYAEVLVGVYDGLIHWVFCSDALHSPDKMKDLVALFKTQRKIIEAMKEKPKPSKKGDKSQGTSKSAEKSANHKNIVFKSVLSIDVAVQLLKAYIIDDDEISRCSEILKSNHEFHMYILDVLDQNIASLKTMLPNEKEKIFPHLKTSGALLLRESIRSVGNEENDDDERERSKIRHYLSTMHSLMTSYVKHYKEKLPQIFKEMTGKSASKDYSSLLFYTSKACVKALLRMLKKEDNSSYTRESALLIQIIFLITRQMEINSKGLIEIQDLINQTCKDHTIDNSTVCESLVQLLLSTTDGIKASSNLVRSFARGLHYRLGDVEQDVTLEECIDYKIVSEFSSHSILATLCNYIDETLNILKHALYKLKQYLTAFEKYDREEVDKMISLKFAVIVHALHEIFQSAVPHGPAQDLVLNVTIKFYSCICMYVKYYIENYRINKDTTMSDKFEKLIHLCANMLKENSFKMINYINSTTPQHPLGKAKKNVLTKRAIKESKLIPKFVFVTEEYEKYLFKLSKSSKVNLLSGIRITTSRDFRILADNLEEGMKNFEDDDSSKSDEDREDEEEDKENEDDNEEPEELGEETSKSPVPKKRKKQ